MPAVWELHRLGCPACGPHGGEPEAFGRWNLCGSDNAGQPDHAGESEASDAVASFAAASIVRALLSGRPT